MQIYMVGGAVRDALLGLPVQDHDWVVVGATPEALAAEGYLPVGKDFPVFLHPRTKEEYALAAKWFKLAADKKQPEAMLWYGDMQLRGLGGIPQDKKAGVERVRQSAELHNANAMAVLGGYYMDGDVLPRNLREAYKYMMLSERSGNGNARLGLTMLEGKLPKGEQDAVREEVKEWLRKNPAPTRRPNN